MRQNSRKKQAILQTSCKQCGICCTKGGAALHSEDLPLLQGNKIPRKDCITLRKGEFAWNPVNDTVEAIQSDIIKLRGTGGKWTCCYLDTDSNTCNIYATRPVACRTLKCWEPEESLALAGKDLLSREMIIGNDTHTLQHIVQYEKDFPLPDFSTLVDDLQSNSEETLLLLEDMVNRDIAFRDTYIQRSKQAAEEELFLFGRPLFQLLQLFGLTITEKGRRLCLELH